MARSGIFSVPVPPGYSCKHEVATMMQLRETMELVEKRYVDLYTDYFAAAVKGNLFGFAVDSHEIGNFIL